MHHKRFLCISCDSLRASTIKIFALAVGNEDVLDFLCDHKVILRDGSVCKGSQTPLDVSDAELRAAGLSPAKQAKLVELGLLLND